MNATSLRLRLLVSAAAFILIAIVGAGFGLAHLFERHVERSIDQHLNAHLNQVIAGLDVGASNAIEVKRRPADPRFEQALSGLYWEVVVEPGARVLRSRSLWDFEITLLPAAAIDDATLHTKVAGPGGQTLYLMQKNVALPARLGEQTARAAVALNDAEVQVAVSNFTRALVPLLLLLAALLTAAAWLQVAVGLRPLAAMRQRLAAIGAGTEKRLGTGFPDEVQPLAREIDALLDVRDGQVAKARGRAADLAHGLKTPLQVLTGDAERLRAKGETEVADDIERLTKSMQRHVDRELVRARIGFGRSQATADIADVTNQVLRVMQRTSAGERLDWSVDIATKLSANIDAADLAEVIGNLVENAVRYASSRIAIAARADVRAAILTITDDGPGIPADRRDDVVRRGQRLDLSGHGAGLGLAIVSDILDAWGGTLSFATSKSGFDVLVRLPR